MEKNGEELDKGLDKKSLFKNGVFFFNQKSERMFYFILMMIMLVFGLLVKIGVL